MLRQFQCVLTVPGAVWQTVKLEDTSILLCTCTYPRTLPGNGNNLGAPACLSLALIPAGTFPSGLTHTET